jgi:hypothetical protein
MKMSAPSSAQQLMVLWEELRRRIATQPPSRTTTVTAKSPESKVSFADESLPDHLQDIIRDHLRTVDPQRDEGLKLRSIANIIINKTPELRNCRGVSTAQVVRAIITLAPSIPLLLTQNQQRLALYPRPEIKDATPAEVGPVWRHLQASLRGASKFNHCVSIIFNSFSWKELTRDECQERATRVAASLVRGGYI